MNSEYSIYERIDLYLKGQLSAEQKQKFENDLAHDHHLSKQFDIQKRAYELLSLNKLSVLHQKMKTDFNANKPVQIRRKYLFRQVVKWTLYMLMGGLAAGGIAKLAVLELNDHTASIPTKKSNESVQVIREEMKKTECQVSKEPLNEGNLAERQQTDTVSEISDYEPAKKLLTKDTLEEKIPKMLKPIQDSSTHKENEEKISKKPKGQPKEQSCEQFKYSGAIKITNSPYDVVGGSVSLDEQLISGGTEPFELELVDPYGREYSIDEPLNHGSYKLIMSDVDNCQILFENILIKRSKCRSNYESVLYLSQMDMPWPIPGVDGNSGEIRIIDKMAIELYSYKGMINEYQEWDGYDKTGQLIVPGVYKCVITYDDAETCVYDLTVKH